MTLNQEVDSIIAEENLSDANLAGEETPSDIQPEGDQPNTTPADGAPAPGSDEPADEAPKTEEPKEDKPTEQEKVAEEQPSNVVSPKSTPSAPAPVQFDQSKIFDEQGNARPFTEVVKVGEYLATQIQPVEVVGKDGKTYSFNTIHDVETQFPDGFEAKNNLEKLKFESAIVANDNKFNEAVSKLKEAEQEYSQYTSEVAESRKTNESLANEYRAMADQGLVPKVGDPRDPKFGESEAVKEMNRILEWMDKTNAENAEKGLGKISSLYYAKQLMDLEGDKVEKENKKQDVINERQHVASLSSSPTPTDDKKPPAPDIPLSRLADDIIQSEGLR